MCNAHPRLLPRAWGSGPLIHLEKRHFPQQHEEGQSPPGPCVFAMIHQIVCNRLKNSPYATRSRWEPRGQGLPLLVTLWASVHVHAATGTRGTGICPKEELEKLSGGGKATPHCWQLR